MSKLLTTVLKPQVAAQLQKTVAEYSCKASGSSVQGCNIMKRTTAKPKLPDACRKSVNKKCNKPKCKEDKPQMPCGDKKPKDPPECEKPCKAAQRCRPSCNGCK